MDVCNLPPEVVHIVFDHVVESRSFARVMRLRLVSRRFRYFIDESIIRRKAISRMTDLPRTIGGSLRRMHDWQSYLCTYLARQASIQRSTTSSLGRIHRAARILCEGYDDPQSELFNASLKSLVRLTIRFCPKNLLQEPPRTPPCSDSDLEADVYVAAVYLGRKAYIERLTADGAQPTTIDSRGYVSSNVLGNAFEAAAYQGNVETIQFLMSRKGPTTIDPDIGLMYDWRLIIRWLNAHRRRDAFYFAIDMRPPNLPESNEDYRRYHDVVALMKVADSTPHPDIYARISTILGNIRRRTPLEHEPMRASISYDNVEMVHHFLNHGVPPGPPVGQYRRSQNHLLSAARSRNETITKILLDAGADPNFAPGPDRCLSEAAWKGSIALVRMLLDGNADIDGGCPPPIVISVVKEHTELFYFLRERGAELHTPETGGWAMALAKSHGLQSMVELLVREGVGEDMVLHRAASYHEISWQTRLLPITVRRRRYTTLS
ncbi:ankyrin [Hypomontagnella monticulosa]|nr:ankyrin [Hypomontagnella monticulosa]